MTTFKHKSMQQKETYDAMLDIIATFVYKY